MPAGLIELACLAAFAAIWTKVALGIPFRHPWGPHPFRVIGWAVVLSPTIVLGLFVLVTTVAGGPANQGEADAAKPLPPCLCSHPYPVSVASRP